MQAEGNCHFRYPTIRIDGNENDWNAIPPLQGISDQGSDFFLKVYCSNDNLNILLSGDSIQGSELYIDTDNNPLSGEKNPSWKSSGFEFKCVNDTLFHYTSGSYSRVGVIDSFMTNAHRREFKIPLTSLSIDNSNTYLSFALVIRDKQHQLLLPFRNRATLSYERVMRASNPDNLSVRRSVTSPSTKLIASWLKCEDCVGYVLTRTNTSTGVQTEFDLTRTETQLIDDGLDRNTLYEYSVYSYNFAGKSETIGPVQLSTTTGLDELKSSDDIAVWPVPASDQLFIKFGPRNSGTVVLKFYTIDGRLVYNQSVDLGDLQGDAISVPASRIGHGLFFLQMNVMKKNVAVRKIILE